MKLLPAHQTRETFVQTLLNVHLFAGLDNLLPCIFPESPCILQNCRERWVLKPVIVGGFLLAGIAAWFFNLASTETTLVAVAVIFAFFADQGALAMTVYTPEVYPLRIRGIGTACAMACGRIAGVISPFAVGLIIGAQNISLMWWLMGVVEMIAALMSLWLAIETRGVNLERLSEAATPGEVPV